MSSTNTPHPNAEIIKAWADGKIIQWFVDDPDPWWTDYFHEHIDREPGPWETVEKQWRIKPDVD